MCRYGADTETDIQTDEVIIFACLLAGICTPFISITLNVLLWNPYVLGLFLYFYYIFAYEIIKHSHFSLLFLLILFYTGTMMGMCCVSSLVKVF